LGIEIGIFQPSGWRTGPPFFP